MSDSAVLLRRHGLALVLTGLLVWVFVTATLPALRERDAARARREALQQELEASRQELLRATLWLQGAQSDPLLRERLQDAWERSPDVPGPREVSAPRLPAAGDAAGEPGAEGGSAQPL